MTIRALYSDFIGNFLDCDPNQILGSIVEHDSFAVETLQRDAWLQQIQILKSVLLPFRSCGKIYFEYSIPRMGRRIDVVVLIKHVVFVIEFKVNETKYKTNAIEQVWDYALDLKNFHEPSHHLTIAPILVPTGASSVSVNIATTVHDDGLLIPICASIDNIGKVIELVLELDESHPINLQTWETGRYCPTPTIIEAAQSLYRGHSVADISRNDATAINLDRTSNAIAEIIRQSKEQSRKSIGFVTGVPGAGKTLVGLNVATQHIDNKSDLYSVFLSGNAPLVAVLREALARDKIEREVLAGRKITKGAARSEVKLFIQNVHNFRDEGLIDASQPPIEHVAIFDEAQRAWDVEQTSKFMRQKKGIADFNKSEPEFLISCLDRHQDWAVIVCLVGGGQEINTGEAGISEWLKTLATSFPHWDVHISSDLHETEYAANKAIELFAERDGVHFNDDLHLAVSLRSFRAEKLSSLVKLILDQNEEEARSVLQSIEHQYPIVITRSLIKAKEWIKTQARGSERYGIVVSSQAHRLKPYAIDIKSPVDPVHWFLDNKDDVRSSYYLEDAATEFHVQGLELDWACVVWDGDFRYHSTGWRHYSFVGDRWNKVLKTARQLADIKLKRNAGLGASVKNFVGGLEAQAFAGSVVDKILDPADLLRSDV
ncbi:MAG: DUF2075 domain-containing protein, partial [Pirellulales bacterium]|nr:DUF2075 domain-containing protein [Pirellulales bacterium]